MDKAEIRRNLQAALADLARCAPCSCRPYRGGTTHKRHFSTCQWADLFDGFEAAAFAVGVPMSDLEPVECGWAKGEVVQVRQSE